MTHQSSELLSVARSRVDAPNATFVQTPGQPRPLGGARHAASVRPLALVSADLAAFAAASGVGWALRVGLGLAMPNDPDGQPVLQGLPQWVQWNGWGSLLVLTLLLSCFGARGRYTARAPFWTELSAITGGVFVAFLGDAFLRASVYAAPVGLQDAIRWALFVPLLVLLRQGAQAGLQARGLWTLRTLIVGEPAAVQSARAALTSEAALGYEVVGSVGLHQALAQRLGAAGAAALREFGAEFVVVAMSGHDPAAENQVAATLARAQVPFALVPAFEGIPVTGITKQYFLAHDVMLLTCGNNLARPVCRVLKALFDQAVAATLLVLLSPLFLMLCALIRLDGGPAFFGHRRIGEGGQRFRCMKFRTMTTDADAVLRELLGRDAAALVEWTATQKLRHDPRITALGRVLRKTSLDELPQLLNVLRGEMSLVGPRPIVDAEIERYGDKIGFYYESKPGITGLWQVSGRSNTSYEHRVQLDVWYVRNWTLWHDIAILLKTVPAVLLKDGAV